MDRNLLVIGTFGLLTFVGCDQNKDLSKPISKPVPPVTIEDVKRDAVKSLNTTTAYSEQQKEKLVMELKDQMAAMDKKIEDLREKGKDLAAESKANWDLKMAAVEEKRKLANERLEEVGKSSSSAWSDVEKGAKAAWDDLAKAFQEASKEF